MVKHCKIHYWLIRKHVERTVTYADLLIGQNLAVCGPSASSHSSHASLLAVWILRVEINPNEAQSNLHDICNSHRLTAAGVLPPRLDPRVHTSTTNALFTISLCSIFPPSFPSLFCLCFVPRENKMFSENEIRNIMFQVLSGLVFVHKHGKKLPSYIFSSFFCCCVCLLHEPQLKPTPPYYVCEPCYIWGTRGVLNLYSQAGIWSQIHIMMAVLNCYLVKATLYRDSSSYRFLPSRHETWEFIVHGARAGQNRWFWPGSRDPLQTSVYRLCIYQMVRMLVVMSLHSGPCCIEACLF